MIEKVEKKRNKQGKRVQRGREIGGERGWREEARKRNRRRKEIGKERACREKEGSIVVLEKKRV